MEIAERITPLSSILAGFALAITVSLLLYKRVDEPKQRYETWAITAFGLSSVLLTSATFALGFLLIDPEWFTKTATESSIILMAINTTNVFGLLALLFGYLFFMAGISLIGFWHSIRVGRIFFVASLLASLLSLLGFIAMFCHIWAQQAR